jgi:ATP-binding cassette subfamily C protein CydD
LIDRRLLHDALPERGRLAAAVLLGGLGAAAACVQWAGAAGFVDAILLRGKTAGQALPWLAAFGLAAALRAVAGFAADALSAGAGLRLRELLRLRLARRIAAMGPAAVGRERSAELTTTLTEGVDSLEPAFSQFVPQAGVALLAPLIILVAVTWRDPISGAILFITGPLAPLFMALIGKLAQERSQRQWGALARLGAHLLDSLEGLATLRAYGQVGRRLGETRAATERFRDATMDVVRIAFLSAFALEMIGTLSTALVAVQVGIRLLYGRMEFAPALTVLMLAPEFHAPLRALGARFHTMVSANAAASRVYGLLDGPEPGAQPAGEADAGPGRITLDCVSYRYPGAEAHALRGASAELPERGLVAVVGRSGAGKSTLARLLLGWIEPAAGSLRRGGTVWRPRPGEAAWLSQQPYLFHATVAQNLRSADPQASEERLWDALREASAEGFVRDLPRGLDTVLGDRGGRLSAGQAQRIALARTLLQPAPLVLLDEPTSNLDALTEEAVSAAVQRMAGSRLVVVIAHRVQTCRAADLVVLLEEGVVAQHGRYDELASVAGPFADLVRAAHGTET